MIVSSGVDRKYPVMVVAAVQLALVAARTSPSASVKSSLEPLRQFPPGPASPDQDLQLGLVPRFALHLHLAPKSGPQLPTVFRPR